MIVHVPIALVIFGHRGSIATFSGECRWRNVAVANLRAGALFGQLTAIAGWRLALPPGIEPSALLESHRWLGAIAAAATVGAALASSGTDGLSSLEFALYRLTLFASAVLVAVTGHFGWTTRVGFGFFSDVGGMWTLSSQH